MCNAAVRVPSLSVKTGDNPQLESHGPHGNTAMHMMTARGPEGGCTGAHGVTLSLYTVLLTLKQSTGGAAGDWWWWWWLLAHGTVLGAVSPHLPRRSTQQMVGGLPPFIIDPVCFQRWIRG